MPCPADADPGFAPQSVSRSIGNSSRSPQVPRRFLAYLQPIGLRQQVLVKGAVLTAASYPHIASGAASRRPLRTRASCFTPRTSGMRATGRTGYCMGPTMSRCTPISYRAALTGVRNRPGECVGSLSAGRGDLGHQPESAAWKGTPIDGLKVRNSRTTVSIPTAQRRAVRRTPHSVARALDLPSRAGHCCHRRSRMAQEKPPLHRSSCATRLQSPNTSTLISSRRAYPDSIRMQWPLKRDGLC